MKYAIFKPRESERNFLFSVIMLTAKMLFFVILLIGLIGGGVVAGIAKGWVDTAPNLDLAQIGAQSQTSFIYDSSGNLIMEFKGSENRIYVEIADIPQQLINAVIAVEDSRFYEHHGVDLKRIVGALVNNIMGGNTQGASTITCQLVKLTLLNADQNYKRKMQEAYLALELEKQLTKEQILEAYLNVIYMGGSSYGVKIAAQDYFGKDLNELSLRECAALARIIRNPYRYNPRANYYTRHTPQVIEEQTNYVLEEMLDQRLITEEEYQAAHDEKLNVIESSTAASAGMYDNAYYVEYSIYDVVTKMLRVEGLEDTSYNRSQMETKLRNGGYKVFTSLRPDVQQAVQDVITGWTQYPSMRYSNDSATQASLGGGEYLTVVQPQCACAVMDWHTGELVAIVGGRNEPVQRKQLNRAYQNDMPVGSSIKPLAVYGPAFDLGYSPGTPVMNLPIPIKDWVSETGYPNNFGGGSFSGVESMRKAINQSHNTSTAHVLMDYVGIENAVTYLLKLGVNPNHIRANGSGLALGSSGLSVIELATGFGAIANQGVYQESYAFTQILNPDGTVYIDVREVQETWQAFKPSTAYMLVDVLKGCVGPDGTGSRANFGDITVAGKTGTNTNNIGVTFAGMTGYYSAAVWVGSDNYKPLTSDATGGTYAAPLWAEIMSQVHLLTGCTTDRAIISGAPADFHLTACTVCAVSGMLPTSACRNDVNDYGTNTDYYLSGTEPTASCNMHRAVRICAYSHLVASPSCHNTRVFGMIFIPKGHPLRYAKSLDDVTKYFEGASTNESSTSLAKCTLGR
ncbi:MAG: transglycosylase domain-containing protein [Clostridia bacterium]|nr:transglycosylase domain-containing protein [Clostridia bacterium]